MTMIHTVLTAVNGRYGSFHIMWIILCMAGKTVWPLVNTCHAWAPRWLALHK